MSSKRKIEVFTAGCSPCVDALALVQGLACPSCEVESVDVHQEAGAARAREYGIRSVPAVVVDGTLADCCANRGTNETALRAAGVGVPL